MMSIKMQGKEGIYIQQLYNLPHFCFQQEAKNVRQPAVFNTAPSYVLHPLPPPAAHPPSSYLCCFPQNKNTEPTCNPLPASKRRAGGQIQSAYVSSSDVMLWWTSLFCSNTDVGESGADEKNTV